MTVLLATVALSVVVGAVVLSASGEWKSFKGGGDYVGSEHNQDH
jgi:hypothetical protein